MEKIKIQKSIIKKYRKELWTPFIKAIKDYNLINDGDRIAIAISGGKDSFLLSKLMHELYINGKRNFSLGFITINPGYNNENLNQVLLLSKRLDIPIEIINKRIFENAVKNSKKPCYLCAKMRRGILYNEAKNRGYNKVALGHHYDDVIETIFMNIIVTGIYMTMMPKLYSKNYKGMELIRPLYYIRENDIIKWSNHLNLKFLDCACPVTKNIDNSKRKEVKDVIKKLKKTFPNIEKSIFASSKNVNVGAVIGKVINGEKISFLESYEEKYENLYKDGR